MNDDGWTSVDGRGRTDKIRWMKSDRIERKELDGTIDGTMTNDNEQRTAINNNCDDDGITKQSASASFVAMAYKKEERNFIFLLLHVFF